VKSTTRYARNRQKIKTNKRKNKKRKKTKMRITQENMLCDFNGTQVFYIFFNLIYFLL
jgi:hypothetical protein